MIAESKARPRRGWLVVLVVLVLIPWGPLVSRATTIGNLTIEVRGSVGDIVVVDPLGRTDRNIGGVPHSNIPGCSRWPGGLGDDEEDESNADSSGSALMVFQMDSVQFGRYIVCARADQRLTVTLNVMFDSAVSGLPPCIGLTRTDQIAPGRHAWTIDVRNSPPKGECPVRIARLAKGKATPRHCGGR